MNGPRFSNLVALHVVAPLLFLVVAPTEADEPQSKEQKPDDYCLEFSGEQYVLIPQLRYDGSHPISLEAIVTPRAPDPKSVRSAVVANLELAGVGIHLSRGRWMFHVNDGRGSNGGYASAVSDQKVTLDEAVHLAGVYDGEKVRLFVGGKLQEIDDKTTQKHVPSPHNFMIGADPNGKGEPHQFFKGTIDEVRISKVARYTKDFTPAKRLKPDEYTLILYHFDKGNGMIAYDASKNETHGEIRGARWGKVTGLGNLTNPARESASTAISKPLDLRSPL